MIKLVIFDIDGVLTDGNVLVDETGREYKSFSLTEMDAIHSLKRDGISIAAITGEDTRIVDVFRRRVPWDSFLSGCKDKVSGIREMEARLGVARRDICYIGDGIYDVPAIRYAGLGVAPANSIPEAKEAADIVLSGSGGKGCIRELCKILSEGRASSMQMNPSCPPTGNRAEPEGRTAIDKFKITGRVAVITGGAGLMGVSHAEAVLSGGGIPVLLDISDEALERARASLSEKFPGVEVIAYNADITDRAALESVLGSILGKYGRIDILINNAANNPKMEDGAGKMNVSSLEDFPVSVWDADIAVGLTGALLCTQVFGGEMARRGFGVILNISSDLGVVAPDQRIYREDGADEAAQKKKPVTYSVVKHGLIGLTKYIATYWAEKGVRCNALAPAGIENGQDAGFIKRLTSLVPMGRMAARDEYQSTVLYMVSDASAYMTGATVIVDGGRTCW